MQRTRTLFALAGAVVLAASFAGCAGGKGGATGSAAQQVYVKPGEHDPYYAFLSGGLIGISSSSFRFIASSNFLSMTFILSFSFMKASRNRSSAVS